MQEAVSSILIGRSRQADGLNRMILVSLIVYGVCAGAFSPLGVFGQIAVSSAHVAGIDVHPLALFAGTFAFSASCS